MRLRAIIVTIFAAALCLPLFGATAHASTDDFTVHSFAADYTLDNTDKQGSMTIVETIDLTFDDQNHGILRAIPQTYKRHKLQIHVDTISSSTGAPTQYTTYTQNGNLVLKIGDPSRTVTGLQNYKITYHVSNVVTFYDDHDELYWDVNGDQWRQQFEQVSVALHVPDQAKLTTQQPVCYAGYYGDTNQNCTIAATGSQIAAKTNSILYPSQTLSIVVGFQKGYFSPSTSQETFMEYAGTILKVLVPILASFVYAYTRWRRYGRDAKGRGVMVAEYEAPFGLKPIEVATVLRFTPSQKDITATIIDLAVRGYVRIHQETVVKKFAKDKTSYSLELTNNDVTNLKEFERKTLESLFENSNFEAGSTVQLDSLKNKFYKTVQSVIKITRKAVEEGGYVSSASGKASIPMWVLVGVLFVLSFFAGAAFGPALTVGLVVSIFILAGFALAMPARTAKGVEAKEKAEGLKLYLKTAEADRIKMLQSPSSPYATSQPAPKRTVELFEKLLAYAIVLGVEKEWAGEFNDIYVNQPEWYAGNMSTFNAVVFASALSGQGFGSAMMTSYSSPSSSGSSGFGGGGFSGGGGGGGGGGGW